MPNQIQRSFESNRDGDGLPLLSIVAYTICRACDYYNMTRGIVGTGYCGHLLIWRFPWILPTEDLRGESCINTPQTEQAVFGHLPPPIVEHVFAPSMHIAPVDTSVVIGVDPGAGRSVTAAIAAALTPKGAHIHGMFRSTDLDAQPAQFADFVIDVARRLPAVQVYVLIERNLVNIASALVSSVTEALNGNRQLASRVVLLRAPGKLNAGIGITTTARSKTWIGKMVYHWIMNGWVCAAPDMIARAFTHGTAVLDPLEYVKTEFCQHMQSVSFAGSEIRFKVAGNDDFVCVLGFVLLAFVYASPSIRPHFTDLNPEGRLPSFDGVVLLGEMISYYRSH